MPRTGGDVKAAAALVGWARAHPREGRAALRFGLRLAFALAIIPPLQALIAASGLLAGDMGRNGGAIGGLVVAFWLGGRVADRLAARLRLPEPPAD